MFEFQLASVQRQTGGIAAVFDHRPIQQTAVNAVSTDRMPLLGQVNPNLMRAAGFKLALDQRAFAQRFQHPNVCGCGFSIGGG